MKLPHPYKTWIELYDHILKNTPEDKISNDLLVKIEYVDDNDHNEFLKSAKVPKPRLFQTSLGNIKLKCFDEVQENLRINMDTFIHLISLPCHRDTGVREFIQKLELLVIK